MPHKSKKSKLHFYLDECMPVQCAIYLRSKGINVVHVSEIKAIAKTDNFHLKNSKKLKKTIVSLDTDFKDFTDISHDNHPGIILLSTGDISYVNLNKILDKVLKDVSPDYVKESVLRVSIRKITKQKGDRITTKEI